MLESFHNKFKSGNSIPVGQAVVTRAEYEAACESIGPKWIAVGDALPHPDRCVDLWCKVSAGYNQGDESRVENVFYNSELRYWWYLDDDSDHTVMRGVDVTHWMPLPKAPD